MSLAVVVNAPEGMVLAAESRVTLTLTAPATGAAPATTLHVNYDNATKLLSMNAKGPHAHVGLATYGAGAIGFRSAAGYLPEFEASLPTKRLTIAEYAEKLRDFFVAQWNTQAPGYSGEPQVFYVAGYDPGNPYGETYEVRVPNPAAATRMQVAQATNPFGIWWGGQIDIVNRIVMGVHAPVLTDALNAAGLTAPQIAAVERHMAANAQLGIWVEAMPLQDCIDLAVFLVRATIEAQRLTVGLRGCGGAIDVAAITSADGLSFLKRKVLVAGDG